MMPTVLALFIERHRARCQAEGVDPLGAVLLRDMQATGYTVAQSVRVAADLARGVISREKLYFAY